MVAAITLQEALGRVLAEPVPPPAVEMTGLADALGRVLAAPVAADGPWPVTDRSAMDGFAVIAAGVAAGATLPVVGESLAGRPFDGRLSAGQAIRIMTGAVVPAGADAVVQVEHTSGFASDPVRIDRVPAAGQNIRRRGSEVQAGQLLIPAGSTIRAAEIGALAVLGRVQVPVVRRPRVAILATGDEVVAVDQQPAPHQLRESNSHALAAQVATAGGVPVRLGIAPDDPGPLRELLQRGLADCDLLLTIGGISMGSHDLVADALTALGVERIFHGIQLKPGKPTWFGRARGGGVHVFGLPGNPASCFTVFELLVRPLLARRLGTAAAPGGEVRARLGGAPAPGNARLQAVPARLVARDGALTAELAPPSPSGDPFALLPGDAFALLPPPAAPAAGSLVSFVRYGTGPGAS